MHMIVSCSVLLWYHCQMACLTGIGTTAILPEHQGSPKIRVKSDGAYLEIYNPYCTFTITFSYISKSGFLPSYHMRVISRGTHVYKYCVDTCP